jgi:hypothetical protein
LSFNEFAMSMDYCAIITAVMAALLLLLIAEFQAGVRSNREIKRELDSQFEESIKKKIVAEHTNTPISATDLPAVSADLDRYRRLRESLTRHVVWLWIFTVLGAAMGVTLVLVLCWAGRAKPSDEAQIPADSGLAIWSLAFTIVFMALLVLGFWMRHRASAHFRVLQARIDRARRFGIDDWEALARTYDRWDEGSHPHPGGAMSDVMDLINFPLIMAQQRKYFE